ncbi:hypothetical protein SCHPADRAFT_943415 [Schizopora paradoxa]|uniref:CipC-like antibiotic response protein n=1 Tax=Schizopora paradoxa TaxID=27342 RepID=A0A0H2RJR3_9AGAM|nr:hypothetical protein SCHPADRAFT_943415 [Schizopora paradoxa]
MSFDFGGFNFNPFTHDKAREHHEYLESRAQEQGSGHDSEKPRGAPLSHEIIAGAAAFEVMKGFEKHKEQHGKEETLAGLAAAEAINIAEKHHHKLEDHERKDLAVKAVQQTAHLANEREEGGRSDRRDRREFERPERERDVEVETETKKVYRNDYY